MNIRENDAGLFTIALRPCTAAVLLHILPQTGMTVWLRGYRPRPAIDWWTASLPLRPEGPPVACSVRDLEMDLQFPVQAFRAVLPQLEDRGLDLYLMDRPVPATLTLKGLDYPAAVRVLLANGFLAHFDLPHAHETAVIAARSRSMLEEWVKGGLWEWLQ